jgi:hypothetical protein
MEKYNRSGVPPEPVTTSQLAEKVIKLYWLQANPFITSSDEPLISFQNAG